MQKRGLSTVIVTLILILVSLVAVGIIWLVVRNIIQTGTEGVGLSQFSLSAKILDVAVDNSSNNVSLSVKRNAGKGELQGISFVFSSDGNTEVITRNISLKELEEKRFNFSLTKFNVLNLISVSIIPLIKQDGKEISGIALDKYTLGKNQNTQSGQTTCTPAICGTPGYMCGLRNNGSCGGTLSCGNCPSGFSCNSTGGCVASGTYVYALSCSYNDVSSAINSANSGDTVIVPAGSCTWNNQLTITKGITLHGAGTGNTTIISNIFPSSNSLIYYSPANPSLNEAFRITEFNFNIDTKSQGIEITHTAANAINKIRIDHNNFFNCLSVSYPIIGINGIIYGVMDHNTFTGTPHIDIYGNNEVAWDNTQFQYGSADNFYIEDNNLTGNNTFHSGGQGGKYSIRYNNYNYTISRGLFPWFDAHGNQPSGVYATMGVEIYGNKLIANSISAGNDIRAFDHRGGKGLFFYNKVSSTITSAPHILAREEYNDSISPTSNSQPQHVSDGYYWNNRKESALFTLSVANSSGLKYEISENVDFYNYNPSFDGTVGVGCGTLASRPSTCVIGVGYWATEQSCTALNDENVGTNPTTPISGTLYKCTSTNTWTPYYQPYPYPHPLTLI